MLSFRVAGGPAPVARRAAVRTASPLAASGTSEADGAGGAQARLALLGIVVLIACILLGALALVRVTQLASGGSSLGASPRARAALRYPVDRMRPELVIWSAAMIVAVGLAYVVTLAI